MAGQEHGDPLGDAGADQVAGGGAAAIVEEAGRHAGRLGSEVVLGCEILSRMTELGRPVSYRIGR